MSSRVSVRRFLWADIKWLLVWVILCTSIGSIFGYGLYGFLAGLLVFIVRQWRALYVLYTWVVHQSSDSPPEVSGILSELSTRFYQIHKTEMRLREALMSNVRRARESISALEEAVVLIDGDSRIEWWNPAAERILGLKSGDQGLHVLSIVRDPDFVTFFKIANFKNSLQAPSWLQEGRSLQFEITPFGDNDKLMIVDDVTRMVQLEQVRRDFIANVSHELKTPLTVFSGYLENFLHADGVKPAWQRAFGQMHAQAQRMNNIVNDLLMLSRLENDNDEHPQTRVDMPDLLIRLFDDAQAYNADFGHLIHLNIDSQRALYGNLQELTSAFGNLIYNAIKYTPKGGDIDINWHVTEDAAVFSVTDNGIGIPDEHISRLSERFYRVDAGRSRETGGTGLGLAIVKHVLLRHDGELKIESKLGKGSTFSTIFPPSRVR